MPAKLRLCWLFKVLSSADRPYPALPKTLAPAGYLSDNVGWTRGIGDPEMLILKIGKALGRWQIIVGASILLGSGGRRAFCMQVRLADERISSREQSTVPESKKMTCRSGSRSSNTLVPPSQLRNCGWLRAKESPPCPSAPFGRASIVVWEW